MLENDIFFIKETKFEINKNPKSFWEPKWKIPGFSLFTVILKSHALLVYVN
jgi:hypothetical protein